MMTHLQHYKTKTELEEDDSDVQVKGKNTNFILLFLQNISESTSVNNKSSTDLHEANDQT